MQGNSAPGPVSLERRRSSIASEPEVVSELPRSTDTGASSAAAIQFVPAPAHLLPPQDGASVMSASTKKQCMSAQDAVFGGIQLARAPAFIDKVLDTNGPYHPVLTEVVAVTDRNNRSSPLTQMTQDMLQEYVGDRDTSVLVPAFVNAIAHDGARAGVTAMVTDPKFDDSSKIGCYKRCGALGIVHTDPSERIEKVARGGLRAMQLFKAVYPIINSPVERANQSVTAISSDIERLERQLITERRDCGMSEQIKTQISERKKELEDVIKAAEAASNFMRPLYDDARRKLVIEVKRLEGFYKPSSKLQDMERQVEGLKATIRKHKEIINMFVTIWPIIFPRLLQAIKAPPGILTLENFPLGKKWTWWRQTLSAYLDVIMHATIIESIAPPRWDKDVLCGKKRKLDADSLPAACTLQMCSPKELLDRYDELREFQAKLACRPVAR